MEISRDKKNPTWAWVWDRNKPEKFSDNDKKIIADICREGVICVYFKDEEAYLAGSLYRTIPYENYEIIKNPEYRCIKTIEDYLEVVKDRKSLLVIAKDGSFTLNIGLGDFDYLSGKVFFRGYDGEYVFENCVFCDDRSPVGVKVK